MAALGGLLAGQTSSAQTTVVVSGSWYGRADVDVTGLHNNYLTELVIKQKGNRVDGIFGYYFRDKYQSFFVHGRYNPKTREITIMNIPVIYYNSNSTLNSIDCNTNFRGVLISSKVKTAIKGAFYNDGKYKYMCPDLKVSYTLDKSDQRHDSLIVAVVSDAKIWKPQADDFVVDAAAEAKKEDSIAYASAIPAAATRADSSVAVVQDSVKNSIDSTAKSAGTPAVVTAPRPHVDSAQAQTAKPDSALAKVVKPDSALAKVAKPDSALAQITKPVREATAVNVEKIEKEDSKKIAESFIKRTAVLNKVLDVESDSVRLSFYDNGEIDGDSISVFVNSHLVLKHQELASRALTLYLKLDSSLEINSISMFAENLGKFPPNTALMVVTDGKNRYEVFMSSSLTENATIRLRRKKRS